MLPLIGKFYSMEEANALDDDALRNKPVFRHHPNGMFQPEIPAVLRNEILARGIPELSYPIGYTNVSPEYCVKNIDMHADADLRAVQVFCL
jgi:hypothetical protein